MSASQRWTHPHSSPARATADADIRVIRVRDTLQHGVKLQATAPHVRCLHTPSMVWSDTLHEDSHTATTIRLKSQVTQHQEILAGKTPGLFPALADRDICCPGRSTSTAAKPRRPSRIPSLSSTVAIPSSLKKSGSAGMPRRLTPCPRSVQTRTASPTLHPPRGSYTPSHGL